MDNIYNDNIGNRFADETADVTIRSEIIRFYGPALGRETMGTLVHLKDLALRLRENDPERCKKDEFSLSYTELAAIIGCCRDPVIADIKKLTELGLITKIVEKADKSEKRWNEKNLYRIVWPDFAPSQDLVRKYWPSWWVPPEIKPFKMGSRESRLPNSTTEPSSREYRLLDSSPENRLLNPLRSPDSSLHKPGVVENLDGNVVVVKTKETTTSKDFVVAHLMDEVKTCQTYDSSFNNAKHMLPYWKMAVDRTLAEDPKAPIERAIQRVRNVLEVRKTLKKSPDNFRLWFMAGIRDGYEPEKKTEAKPRPAPQENNEDEEKRRLEWEAETRERNLTATVEQIVSQYEFLEQHDKQHDPKELLTKMYQDNPNFGEALEKIRTRKG